MHEPIEYHLWGFMFVWVWICHGICIEVGGQPWVLALTFMRGEPGYELLEIFLFLPPIPSCHRSTKGLQPVVWLYLVFMWFLVTWTWVVRLVLFPTELSPYLNFEIWFVFQFWGWNSGS